jgi:hypothetical protein
MTSNKILISVAIAAGLALPFSSIAGGDKKAGASDSSSTATQAKSNDGGAEAMFMSLDKNKDGNLSKEEVKGTPHDKNFSSLDKNNDGKLTREEHAAAPEHAAKQASGATSPTASGKK